MNEQILNLKFVREVEKYPCLYNHTLIDYSRKDITAKAWNAVGKVVNLTGSQSKEKWRNLRAVFVRGLKPAPSGSSSKNRKPYYLTEVMQFIIPFLKVLDNSSGNLPRDVVKVVMKREDNEDTNESHCTSEEAISPPPQNTPSPLAYPSSPISNRPLSPVCIYPSSSRKRKASSDLDDINTNARNTLQTSSNADNIMEYLKAIEAKLQKGSEYIEDPKRMFLLSLLPDMKAMSDTQTRTFKRKVLELVDEVFEKR